MSEFEINDKDLSANLLALFLVCANEDTDSCDIKINTKKGTIKCHIEFSTEVEQ